MEDLNEDCHYQLSIAQYEELMTLRSTLFDQGLDLAAVDLTIGKVFDPESSAVLTKRLAIANELRNIVVQMREWKIDSKHILNAILSAFSSETDHHTYGIQIAKWNKLFGMTEEMMACSISTSWIDRLIANIFKVIGQMLLFL